VDKVGNMGKGGKLDLEDIQEISATRDTVDISEYEDIAVKNSFIG
jgi:hypothetical protein